MRRTAFFVLPILFLFLVGLLLGAPRFVHFWGYCPDGDKPRPSERPLEFCPGGSILWGLNYCGVSGGGGDIRGGVGISSVPTVAA